MKDTSNYAFLVTSKTSSGSSRYSEGSTYSPVSESNMTSYVERNEHYLSDKCAISVSTTKSRAHKKLSALNEVLSKF